MLNWPGAVGATPDTIRAAIFAGEADKRDQEGLVVREDGRFLGLVKFGKVWRITSGDFVGAGSKVDSQLVRTSSLGQAIAPKKGVLKILPGNNGAECTWQEALALGLHFIGQGSMPSGFAWWRGHEGA